MSNLSDPVKTVGLVVNAPDIFKREDFLAWLNDPANSPATWHQKGQKPTECSDVFVLIDSNFEGDCSDMPEDIWRELCQLAYDTYCDGGESLPRNLLSPIVVRITSLN